MAFWASSEAAYSTKAKPRERPVILSSMRLTDVTAPAWAKWSCSSFSPVWKDRLPTNNLAWLIVVRDAQKTEWEHCLSRIAECPFMFRCTDHSVGLTLTVHSLNETRLFLTKPPAMSTDNYHLKKAADCHPPIRFFQ